MHRFNSYGPSDPDEHFCVERRELVEQCVEHLVGNPDKTGHYFTLWGPPQTGKTWLTRRAVDEVRAQYGERFAVGALSMEGLFNNAGTEVDFLRFRDAAELVHSRPEAARYAKSQGLTSATLAVFVPISDEKVLAALSDTDVVDGVQVVTVAIGWAES